MSKVLFSLILLGAALFCQAQTPEEARSQLAEAVGQAQGSLPRKSAFLTFTALQLSDDELEVRFRVDESCIRAEHYLRLLNDSRGQAFSVFNARNDNFPRLLLASGLGLHLWVSGSRSGKTSELRMSASALKALRKQLEADEQAGQNEFEEADSIQTEFSGELESLIRAGLPQDVGYGMQLTDLQEGPSFVLFRLTTDETVLTHRLLATASERSMALVSEALLASLLRSGSGYLKLLCSFYAQRGKGLKLVADTGSDTSPAVFLVTARQLAAACNSGR